MTDIHQIMHQVFSKVVERGKVIEGNQKDNKLLKKKDVFEPIIFPFNFDNIFCDICCRYGIASQSTEG
jgi:hypothetical protein